jgi:hypothetical protein
MLSHPNPVDHGNPAAVLPFPRLAPDPDPTAPPGCASGAVAELELVRAELERRGHEVLTPETGGLRSSCPVMPHRRNTRSFEARIGDDGALVLRCERCEYTSRELHTALFDRERFDREQSGPWSRPSAGPIPEDDEVAGATAALARMDERDRDAEGARRPAMPPLLPLYPASDVVADGPPDDMPAILRAIDEYPIKALGRRPADYRVLDMMHGSCFRVPRLQRFGRTSRDPEQWQLARTAHLPGGMRIQACQHLALRRDHLGGLYRLPEGLPEELANTEVLGHIGRLAECPPYGVLLEGDGEDLARKICGHKRLCPWCLARWSDDLYGRLMRGPCRPADGSGKAWVMGRLCLPGVEDDAGPVDAEVAVTRSRWGGALIRWATEQLGAVGGVLVHQIGPPRGLATAYRFVGLDHCMAERVLPRFWYEHDLAVVCEVPFGNNEHRDRVLDEIGLGPTEDYELEWPTALDNDDELARIPVEVAATRGDNPHGLRYLWFGTSNRFNPSLSGNSEILTNRELDRRRELGGHGGFDGAVRMQPWWLYTPQEWCEYYGATRGRHLCDAFGSWIGRIPPSPSGTAPWRESERLFSPQVKRARAARRKRKSGRKAMGAPHSERNRKTEDLARNDREVMLEVARPIFLELIDAGGGRRPGRDLLRRTMAERGHQVGSRVAEDITRALKHEFEARDPG